MELNEVKQKIQDLINREVDRNNQQKGTLSFLFDKLGEIKELETIDRLRQFAGGNLYLKAFLTYKAISRGNYQPELAEQMKFEDDEETHKTGQDKLLEAINTDIEQFIKSNEPKPLPIAKASNEAILIAVSERIASGEIKRELSQFGNYLMIENEQGIFKVDLADGKLTPDPAQELLKKHGLNTDNDNNGGVVAVAKIPPIPITWFEMIKWVENKLASGELYLYGHEGGKFAIDNTSEPIIKCDIRTTNNSGDFAEVLDNRWFLKALGEKIKSGSIDREWNGAYISRSGSSAGSKEGGSKYLFYKDDKGSIKLNLWNGKITEKSASDGMVEETGNKGINEKN